MTSTAATVTLLIVMMIFTGCSIAYQYIVFKALDERLINLRRRTRKHLEVVDSHSSTIPSAIVKR